MKTFACFQYRSTPSLTFRGQDRDLSVIAKSYAFTRPANLALPQILDCASRGRDPADHQGRRLGMDLALSSPEQFPAVTDSPSMGPVGQKPLPGGLLASTSSASWSTHDDNVLLNARARSHGWGQIQKEHFPTKTPNACRKRYERLVAKRRGPEWDSEKLERLCRHYNLLREQTWRPLADAVGERWQDIEKACFEKGLKSLTAPSRSHARKDISHSQVLRSDISKHSHPRRPSMMLPLKDMLTND